MTPIERLMAGAATLGVPLTEPQAGQLLTLLDELLRWNRSYNLTAITEPEAMLTHHLLDSLAVHPYLAAHRTVADVGTGAGFPGLPLALVNPSRRFTLIDASGKKVRFVSHAAHHLGLKNVEAVHARVEQMKPAAPLDAVVARAFAALPQLLDQVQGLCGPDSRVLALKGRRPDAELAEVPARWQVEACHALTVPGLEAERTLVIVRPAAAGS
jgi:16S rRNA (guanine527-N7)-methyltransferase